MAKVSGSYESILGGVSTQPPERRKPGQVWDQVNMVSDPNAGLTRRAGTKWLGASRNDLDLNFTGARWQQIDLTVGEQEYSLHYNPTGLAPNTDLVCFNKTTGAILPVQADLDGYTAIPALGPATGLGRFVVFAPDVTTTGRVTEVNTWATEENQKRHLVWVRGGAYSRPFRFALIRGNQKFWVEYTTLASSFPQALDTSDILSTDPDYTKKVNDRTNEYNTAANEWLGKALADVQPPNIAQKLAAELLASNFLGPSGTVEVIGTNICITDPSVEEVEVDDGGDNTLMRGVGNTVGAAALLTVLGYPGKIVRVRPNEDSDTNVFYLQAVAKDQSSGQFTPVTWEECAGTDTTTDPTKLLWFATVENDTLYLLDSPAKVRSVLGLDFPDWSERQVGDADSSPIPAWASGKITHLTTFQDRLLISVGAAQVFSKPGDYLNFYRASVLTVPANDPVEFTAIGGEDDTIRQSVVYDRNLVLFGDKRQYLINGRVALTPQTQSSTIMAEFKNAAGVRPTILGNLLFYGTTFKPGQTAPAWSSVHQFQPGPIQESPESVNVSKQVDTYIVGAIQDLVADTDTRMLFVRTSTGLFVYQFLDSPSGTERLQDSWHSWNFGSLDQLVGVCPTPAGLVVLTTFQSGGKTLYRTSRLTLPVGERGGYHLDYTHPLGDNFTVCTTNAGALPIVGTGLSVDGTVVWRGNYPVAASGTYAEIAAATLVGMLDDDNQKAPAASGLIGGAVFDSYCTLTSPWIRDQNGRPILDGLLTVTSADITMNDTGAIKATIRETDQLVWETQLHCNGSTA